MKANISIKNASLTREVEVHSILIMGNEECFLFYDELLQEWNLTHSETGSRIASGLSLVEVLDYGNKAMKTKKSRIVLKEIKALLKENKRELPINNLTNFISLRKASTKKTTQMTAIYERLTMVFGQTNVEWLKENLLPDWWSDDLAEKIVNKRIAELILSKALSLPLDVFIVNDDGKAIKDFLKTKTGGTGFWELLAESVNRKLNFNIVMKLKGVKK